MRKFDHCEVMLCGRRGWQRKKSGRGSRFGLDFCEVVIIFVRRHPYDVADDAFYETKN